VGHARIRGSTDPAIQVFSPLRQRYNDTHFAALKLILERGIDLAHTSDADLVALFRAELGLGEFTGDDVYYLIAADVRELEGIVRTRSHVVEFSDLEPATEYDFDLYSISFDDSSSQVFRGLFATRSEPDLRPLFVDALDVQVTQGGAAVSFGTNRPATAIYQLVRLSDGAVVATDTLEQLGQTRTRFVLQRLEPTWEYELQLEVTVSGADRLMAAGMPEADAVRRISRRFRTHGAQRPIRLVAPPVMIAGSDRANLVINVNQPVQAAVDYGVVGDGAAPGVLPEDLYGRSQRSVGTLPLHNLALANLSPKTLYRYRITLTDPEGHVFTTDPRGNEQWSRDLRFRTISDGDTLAPVVVRGPVVDIRDVLAVVRFATDVPTSATVFVGTEGGTYSTGNEYEFPDLTPDGERRIVNRHSIVLAGLQPRQAYRYRVEVTSTLDRTTVLEPRATTGKPLGVLQPPGGAGSFTTSNDPDTQFPVILSGPTVSSTTHESAVIEWSTDEPANSEVQFGASGTGEESESSALTETTHKVVLSNLDAGTTYAYLVGSTDAAGNGATLSSQAVFTTDPTVDLTAPSLTGLPEVIYKSNEVATIRWTTDEEATGEVAFGTSADDLGAVRSLPTTGRQHEVTLTNLEAATTYYYQASSADLSGNGPTESAVLSFTTDAGADMTAPAISGIAVAKGDSTAIISWDTDEAADSFVDFGTVSGIFDLVTGDAEDVTAHEVTLTNLDRGQTYYFTVGSTDPSGNGPTRSVSDSFTTLAAADTTAPAAPTGLSGMAGSQQALLSWSANGEPDLAGYNVYRRTGSGSFSAVVTRVSGAAYTDAGLTNDTQYEYRITAIDRQTPANESGYSATVSLTPTLSAAPTVPTALQAGGELLLPTFAFANAEPYAAGATLTYTIQVSTAEDFSDVTAAVSGITGGEGTTSWTITRQLAEGEKYYWRVRAVEGSLVGPFTAAQQYSTGETVALSGDFDGSGTVDLADFFLFADAFGLSAAEYPDYDLDGSGPGTAIDLADFFAFADAFGTAAAKPGGALVLAPGLVEGGRIELRAEGGPLPAAGLPKNVVRLRVAARDVAPLRAYALALSWDPAAVSFTGATQGPGPLLEHRNGRADLFRVLDERPGRVVIASAMAGQGAVSGSGLLAELTFRVRDPGLASGTRFSVEQAYLAERAGEVRRVTDVEAAQLLPTAFALGLAYPNPFNPSTHIDFALAAESPVRLVVFDVLGRVVRTLVQADRGLPAGFHAVTWDGRDDGGRPAGSGIYFYRLQTPAYTRTGRVLMLK
ncbi:MAG: fibronectin type III domain-containing protein, partial [Gemmatimonadota bacterium]